MKALLPVFLALASVAVAVDKPAAPLLVYRSDFPSGETSHWANGNIAQAPKGRRFLGMYGRRDTALLQLEKLPPHRLLRVRLTLFMISSVDGNSEQDGPDFWGISIGQAPELLRTTFCFFHLDHQAQHPQAFPDDYPVNHPAGFGAAELGTLGFRFDMVDVGPLASKADMTYKIEIAFPHDADEVKLRFWSEFTDGWPDEAWGIEKIEVEAVPEFARRSEAELQKLWEILGGTDPMKAFAATWQIAECGPPAIDFLRHRLDPAGGRERIVQLLADSASDDTLIREKARAAIEKLGPADLSAVRSARAGPDLPQRARDELGRVAAEIQQAAPSFVPRVTRLLRSFRMPEADRLATELNGVEKDPIVGNWVWRDNHFVTIYADGTAISKRGPRATWSFLQNPGRERRYTFVWDGGLMTDSIAAPLDGKTLNAKDQNGVRFVIHRAEDQTTLVPKK